MDSMRIDRVEGGYIINKDYPILPTKIVCVSVLEVIQVVRDYFERICTEAERKSNKR